MIAISKLVMNPWQPVLRRMAGSSVCRIAEWTIPGRWTVELGGPSDTRIPARITEIRGLGEFATWRAARAVGDHDLNTFRVRADPTAPVDVQAGATVWLATSRRPQR